MSHHIRRGQGPVRRIQPSDGSLVRNYLASYGIDENGLRAGEETEVQRRLREAGLVSVWAHEQRQEDAVIAAPVRADAIATPPEVLGSAAQYTTRDLAGQLAALTLSYVRTASAYAARFARAATVKLIGDMATVLAHHKDTGWHVEHRVHTTMFR